MKNKSPQSKNLTREMRRKIKYFKAQRRALKIQFSFLNSGPVLRQDLQSRFSFHPPSGFLHSFYAKKEAPVEATAPEFNYGGAAQWESGIARARSPEEFCEKINTILHSQRSLTECRRAQERATKRNTARAGPFIILFLAKHTHTHTHTKRGFFQTIKKAARGLFVTISMSPKQWFRKFIAKRFIRWYVMCRIRITKL